MEIVEVIKKMLTRTSVPPAILLTCRRKIIQLPRMTNINSQKSWQFCLRMEDVHISHFFSGHDYDGHKYVQSIHRRKMAALKLHVILTSRLSLVSTHHKTYPIRIELSREKGDWFPVRLDWVFIGPQRISVGQLNS